MLTTNSPPVVDESSLIGMVIKQEIKGTLFVALKQEHNKYYLSVQYKPDKEDIFPSFSGVGHGPTLEKAVKTLAMAFSKYTANLLIGAFNYADQAKEKLEEISGKPALKK